MKKRIIYECNVCGATSERKSIVRYCEASHLGTMPDKIDRWIDLIRINMNAIEMANCGVAKTDAKLAERWNKRAERTQRELSKFEEENGLKGKKVPENWEAE